jgi:hypothetical protein
MPFAYFNCPEFYKSLVPCFVGTFKQSGLYLYFSAWLIKKKILFESKNRTLWNEVHFVESKTDIMEQILQMQQFPCCLNV